MDISYQYTKKRFEFGRQPTFCEQGPELCDSLSPAKEQQRPYILRNPVHQPTQHTPVYSAHCVNTIRAEYASTSCNHAEGGWPKDVALTDPEATQRYRRKIEKDDGYINCVMESSPVIAYLISLWHYLCYINTGIEHYALQNNAIDMYRIYYAEMLSTAAPERVSCRTVNLYRDPASPSRLISSICWQPEGGAHFAVTYNDLDYYRAPRATLLSYIWDVENANRPDQTIAPPCALMDLQYNPREASILAGGLVSGQVAVWDLRAGAAAREVCQPHAAHRDLVRNVLFINAKSGQEFFSSGPDGACKWWDIRHMAEPIDEMIVDVMKSSFDLPSMAKSNGVSTLEFEPTMPTRFMCGTENGLVVGGNRKGKTPMEQMPARYEAHVGPVWSLERNPGFMKNFLTVGDWTARVWSEDCRESPVVWSPPLRHKVTAGTWSPTRLSLLLLTAADGVLSLWDLLRRQHEPVLTMQVCEEPLLRLRMHEQGSLVACGSKAGTIYMVELSQSLSQSEKADKGLLTLMFERESKRERILEARLREIRLKLRQAEEGGGGSPAASISELDSAQGDRDLLEAATNYFAQVKKEQATIF